MKNTLLSLLLFLSITGVQSQNLSMLNCGTTISNTKQKNSKLLLVIITDVRCGACSHMRHALFTDSLDQKIDICFYEFGPEEKALEKFANVLDRFEVRLAGDCPDKLREFFPRYYLIDRNKNKVICKINGHLPRLYNRIKRKIDRKI